MMTVRPLLTVVITIMDPLRLKSCSLDLLPGARRHIFFVAKALSVCLASLTRLQVLWARKGGLQCL